MRGASAETVLLRDPFHKQDTDRVSATRNIWIAKSRWYQCSPLDQRRPRGEPLFSPDGSQIAFTGDLRWQPRGIRGAGFRVEPRRLTYHPADFGVRGLAPDGSDPVSSARAAFAGGVVQLFTVPVQVATKRRYR